MARKVPKSQQRAANVVKDAVIHAGCDAGLGQRVLAIVEPTFVRVKRDGGTVRICRFCGKPRLSSP